MSKQEENACHTADLPSMKFPPHVYPLYPWIITTLLPLCWFLTRPNCDLFLRDGEQTMPIACHTRRITHLPGRGKCAEGQVLQKASHALVTLGPCTPTTDKVSHQSRKKDAFLWSHMLTAPARVSLNFTKIKYCRGRIRLRWYSFKSLGVWYWSI